MNENFAGLPADPMPRAPKPKPQTWVSIYGGPNVGVAQSYDTFMGMYNEAKDDDEAMIEVTGVLPDGSLIRTSIRGPMIALVSEAVNE